MPVSHFPATLPAPALAGYSRKLMTAQGKQQFLNQTRFFRRTRGSPVIDTVIFRCNTSQRETLRQFYRTQMGYAFEINLPGAGGLIPHQAKFQSALTETPLTGKQWDISTELVIPTPPIIPASELDNLLLIYMNITDGTFADSLNAFAQTEWPTL